MTNKNPIRVACNHQDLVGQSFGLLTVLRREIRSPRSKSFWRCVCACGQECVADRSKLDDPRRAHCGCQQGARLREAFAEFRRQNPQELAVAIVLSNNTAAIVDIADMPMISQYHWTVHTGGSTCYAKSGSGLGSHAAPIMMDIMLMGQREGFTIDHINGNGLDNRRANLRWATPAQQAKNSHGGRGRSQYKGVCWAKRQRKWMVSIMANGNSQHIGYFDNEDDAARAYDAAAIRLHGEFAWLNFQPEVQHE